MRRRIVIALGLAAAMSLQYAPPALAQAAPPQATPPPVPPLPSPPARSAQQPALAFASEAGMILSPILPTQTAAFEQVMEKVRETLEKSVDPVRRQQAAGWKIYKGADPFQGHTLYISVMDPAVKGADYDVFTLLKDAIGDTEARLLFDQLRNAYAAPMHVVNMAPVMSMATGEKK